jgi:hypothetical protein
MQVQQATAEELGLLIAGLRAIYIADQVTLQRRLLVQLETELSTRYGKRIGSSEEQARSA